MEQIIVRVVHNTFPGDKCCDATLYSVCYFLCHTQWVECSFHSQEFFSQWSTILCTMFDQQNVGYIIMWY